MEEQRGCQGGGRRAETQGRAKPGVRGAQGGPGGGAVQGGLGEGEKAEKARVGGRGRELSHILI